MLLVIRKNPNTLQLQIKSIKYGLRVITTVDLTVLLAEALFIANLLFKPPIAPFSL